MSSLFESHWRKEIDRLTEIDQLRQLRMVEMRSAQRIVLNGKTLVNFASNDYLGLSTHPALIEAAARAAKEMGTGSGASRLVSGNLALYEILEEHLAQIKRAEAALVFPSGYHANLGLITALVEPGDTIVLDRLAHASLVDAARLSRARMKVFPHNDPDGLDKILNRVKEGRCIVLVESVYSMDGDRAPAEALLNICQKHDALLVMDDAHGFGVIGESGRGVQETLSTTSSNLIVMGTLSKAMGALGGYVVGSRLLIDYLINRSRTFIYTTALPPSVLASANAALGTLFESQEGPKLLDRLRHNIDLFNTGLIHKGYPETASPTAVFPVVVGGDTEALQLSHQLLDTGLFAPAIRPPTVPKGTARIRISLSAIHENSDLNALLAALPSK